MTDGGAVSFGGAKIALLESRLADETASLVRRLGGEPVSAPSVQEVNTDLDHAAQAVADLIDTLSASRDSIVVFMTGVAVTRMFEVADRMGRITELQYALASAVIVARGPKPTGALSRRGLSRIRTVAEPFTTAEVIDALDALPVEDRDVIVVHYGERNDVLVNCLAHRGARAHEVTLYEWQLPADTGPLSAAIDGLLAGDIPILAFTSQIQMRHLREVAGPRWPALLTALNVHVLVGAVGPTCAAACRAAGVERVITPDHPKLAPLLQSLARSWSSRQHEEKTEL